MQAPAHQPQCTPLWFLPSSSPRGGPWDINSPFHLTTPPAYFHKGQRQETDLQRRSTLGVACASRAVGMEEGGELWSKPWNPRNNSILLVASRMGLGPAPQGPGPTGQKEWSYSWRD